MDEKSNMCKKFRRKIKIRLLDSNNPNSYVCEIFDSSLEKDDPPGLMEYKISDKPLKTEKANIKSYFEILMSNDCRKDIKNNITKENHEFIKKSKKKIIKNGQLSTPRLEIVEIEEGKEELQILRKTEAQISGSDSSDDESLFKVKQKWKNSNGFKHLPLQNIADPSKIHNFGTDFTYPAEFTSQKSNFLSYFSKTLTDVKKNVKKLQQLPGSVKSDESNNKKNNSAISINVTLKESSQNQENELESGKKKQNVKIAPLFLIKERKAMALATQKARHEFLHKQTKLLKVTDSCKNDGPVGFQPTCHIQQKDDNPYWFLRHVPIPFPELCYLNESKMSKVFRTHITQNRFDKENSVINLNEKVRKVDNKLLRELKTKYSILNFDGIIDGLKCKKDKFEKLANSMKETKGPVLKLLPASKNNYEILNSTWIEKYKPSSHEVLGNEPVVNKLRNWLQAWKTFDEELKNLAKMSRKKKKSEKAEDSDDDDDEDHLFVNSDDENFGLKAPTNVCVLSGPNGCGKTALVTSLAEELDFNILEVNASSKRTGKKVLTDFQEATQSHKVQHLSQPQLKGAFVRQTKKTRTKRAKSKDEGNEVCDRKISLLLIEDADIVFDEQDDGFYSAMSCLVQTSKRPFVFVTNNSNYEQLESFKTDDCLLLEMKLPPFEHCCAVASVVSLLEGVTLASETVEFLIIRNRLDLRKSLLDLEFWTDSGEEVMRRGEPFDPGRLWWGLTKFFYSKKSTTGSPINLTHLKRKRENVLMADRDEEGETTKKKVKISNGDCKHTSLPLSESELEFSKSIRNLELLSTIVDAVSTLDLLGFERSGEPVPEMGSSAKDGLSLEENTEEVRWEENNFREELFREIVDCSGRLFAKLGDQKEFNNCKIDSSRPSWDDIRWRNSVDEARDELSRLVPTLNGGDHRSVYLDYLPTIRSICRIERNRSVTNSKRKNRFSHYFSSAEVKFSEKTLNVVCGQIFSR